MTNPFNTIPCSHCGKDVFDDGSPMHVATGSWECEGMNVPIGDVPQHRKAIIKRETLGKTEYYDLSIEEDWQYFVTHTLRDSMTVTDLLVDIYINMIRQNNRGLIRRGDIDSEIERFTIVKWSEEPEPGRDRNVL